MTDFRVLVTGSRTWDAEGTLRAALHELYYAAVGSGADRLVVVHGANPRGADAMADTWVRDHAQHGTVTAERHPADWHQYGRSAGYRRNAEMVGAGADLCLAFVRDDSAGATNCLRLAERAGIATRRWTA